MTLKKLFLTCKYLTSVETKGENVGYGPFDPLKRINKQNHGQPIELSDPPF